MKIAVLVACLTSPSWAAGSPGFAELKKGAAFAVLAEMAGDVAPNAAPSALAARGQGPSKSYAELIRNNDGTTAIVEPYFKSPTATGSVPIDWGFSNGNGVCKLYGYQEMQVAIASGKAEQGAVIGKDGLLSTLRAQATPLRRLLCRGGANQPGVAVSDRVEKVVENDDGSFTLVRPFVRGSRGEREYFAGFEGEPETLCAYFGYARYVTRTHLDWFHAKWRLDAKGRLLGLGTDTSPWFNHRVETVICRQ